MSGPRKHEEWPRWFEHNGRRHTVTVMGWAQILQCSAHVIYDRLEKGWPLAAVLETPVRHGGSRRRGISRGAWK